jgi:hypothetical protein
MIEGMHNIVTHFNTRPTSWRRVASSLVVICTLATNGCGGSSSPITSAPPTSSTPDNQTPPPSSQPLDDPVPADPVNRTPQGGGHFLFDFDVIKNLILASGEDRDGIPALTDPLFVSADDPAAGYLLEDDLVLGIARNGEVKAYPHNIGWAHEIVNDMVGGEPVIVTLCPLTSTSMVFNGEDTDGRIFVGVSGLLFNNNLIMHDRRDPGDNATLYPQMISVGIAGARTGNELAQRPVVETTWRYWKRLYPNTKVVAEVQAEGTGKPISYDRRTYQNYPYGAYRDPITSPQFDTSPALSENPISELFANKDLVLGVRFAEIAKAYPFRVMADEDVINDEIEGTALVVVHYKAESFAVPYSRLFGRNTLTFERVDSTDPVFPFMIRDAETNTTWDLLGRGVSGPNAGQQLDQIPANNAFWFAWATFWKNTGIL